MNPDIFKAYDIRGVYPDEVNEEDAWKIGCAAGRHPPSLVKGYEREQSDSGSRIRPCTSPFDATTGKSLCGRAE